MITFNGYIICTDWMVSFMFLYINIINTIIIYIIK